MSEYLQETNNLERSSNKENPQENRTSQRTAMKPIVMK